MNNIRPAIAFVVLMTALCGLAYPLGMTGLAKLLFPEQANGSLITRDGTVIGSSLIGQNFTSDKYFHGRLSATTGVDPNDANKSVPLPYNAANSGGSNLGPTSKVLIEQVKTEAAKLRVEDPRQIPVDLVTASGSGLDPDITPAAAKFQIPRVAKTRGMSEVALQELVDKHTEPRALGFIGEPCVNVLELNLALDGVNK